MVFLRVRTKSRLQGVSMSVLGEYPVRVDGLLLRGFFLGLIAEAEHGDKQHKHAAE
jgi:hypothetical protein